MHQGGAERASLLYNPPPKCPALPTKCEPLPLLPPSLFLSPSPRFLTSLPFISFIPLPPYLCSLFPFPPSASLSKVFPARGEKKASATLKFGYYIN